MIRKMRGASIHSKRAFSLLELAIVLAISSLMLGFVMNANQTADINNGQCALETRAKLNYINTMIVRYARANDKLPLPAPRNVGVNSANYGRSSSGANIDQIGSGTTAVSFGALPFATMGLPATYASDCWGNKFSYWVTTAMTTNATSGGFLDAAVEGNITAKTTTSNTSAIKLAYAVVSHGPDGLGAVKENYSAANAGSGTPDTAHKWCSGTDLKHLNCTATTAVVADGTYNDGKDAGVNYFDDLITMGLKPVMLPSSNDMSNVYCWGNGGSGELAGGDTNSQTAATLIKGGIRFAMIASGGNHTCGIDLTGKAYCWGLNSDGQLGDNTTDNRNTPTAVNITGLHAQEVFQYLAAGSKHTCAIVKRTDTGALRTFCWGDNTYGQVGDGTSGTDRLIPTLVSGAVYTRIYAGGNSSCGINASNDAYCWGRGDSGQIGDNNIFNRSSPTAIAGYKFLKLGLGTTTTCGIRSPNRLIYCWGDGGVGQLGDGSSTSPQKTPVQATTAGGLTFRDITGGNAHICALTSTGQAYCWGEGDDGRLGNNSVADQNTPQAVSYGYTYDRIEASDFASTCGTTFDGKVFCWGINTWSNLGDGGTSSTSQPVQVAGSGTFPMHFDRVATGATHTCAINPMPPVGWGDNTNGRVGDGTTVTRSKPTFVVMPSDMPYFLSITGQRHGTTHCGIGGNGNAYCWGDSFGTKPGTPIAFPAGVTSWLGVYSDGYALLGNNNKLYGNAVPPAVPSLINIPASCVPTNYRASNYFGSTLCADGEIMAWDHGTTWNWQSQAAYIPAPRKPVKKYGSYGFYQLCYIGADDQLYCQVHSGSYETWIGDGTAKGTYARPGNLVLDPVNGAAPAGYWKDITHDNIAGGAHVVCGINSTNMVYCWGYSYNQGMMGNNMTWSQGGPTKVYTDDMPEGANTVFTGVWTNEERMFMTTDMGDLYFSGKDYNGSTQRVKPLKIALPVGAMGYTTAGANSVGSFTAMPK